MQVAPSSWTLTDDLPTAYLPGGAPGGPGGADGALGSSGGFGSEGFGSALPSVAAGPITSGNIKATQGADGSERLPLRRARLFVLLRLCSADHLFSLY